MPTPSKTENMHPDFKRILALFIKQYGKEALRKFELFITKNGLNITKRYNVNAQFHESFEWIEPLIQPYKQDKQAKYYLIRALTANISMNNNDYGPYDRLEDAAKTLSWRPVNIDHDHSQWLPYPRTRTDFSNANEFSVEATLRVDNQDAWLQRMIDNGEILHPSIEGRPDPMGGYHFTGMALLRKGEELPGDPLTEILPLVFNESIGKSLCHIKHGKLVCECKKLNEVKESMSEEEPKIECPEGEHYDLELEKCVPNVVQEQEVSLPEPPIATQQDDPILPEPEEDPAAGDTSTAEAPECPAGYHWDAGIEQCVLDEVGTSDDSPMTKLPAGGGEPTSPPTPELTEQEVPPATNAPSTVAADDTATCPAGQHWDPDAQACVNDVQEECEAGWHYDIALQKCVPDEPAAVNERKMISDLRLENAELRVKRLHDIDVINGFRARLLQKNRVVATKNVEIARHIKVNAKLEGRISEKKHESRRKDASITRLNKEASTLMKRNHNLGRDLEDKDDQLLRVQENLSKTLKNRAAILVENQTFVEENLKISSELTNVRIKEVRWNTEKKRFTEDLAKAMKHQKYLYEFLKKHNFEIVDIPT